MDRPQIVPEPLSRLRRWWLLLTVLDHRRCSSCARAAVIYETDTELDGSVVRVTETRFCGGCFGLRGEGPEEGTQIED